MRKCKGRPSKLIDGTFRENKIRCLRSITFTVNAIKVLGASNAHIALIVLEQLPLRYRCTLRCSEYARAYFVFLKPPRQNILEKPLCL